jgi:hypothetical protein
MTTARIKIPYEGSDAVCRVRVLIAHFSLKFYNGKK